MSIIIFIIILGVLIFVHEAGHFLVAKWSKIRVDEFAIGFPPKLFSFTKKGTKYALNLIPFGGYVKIFGETPDEESSNPEAKDSFVNKSKWTQAAVLIAGITFNIIFAWILFSISFLSGFPSIVTEANRDRVFDPNVVITSVAENSPAMQSGIRVGDKVKSLVAGEVAILTEPTVEGVQEFISDHSESVIDIKLVRANGLEEIISVTPAEGILEDKKAVGITMSLIGQLKLGLFGAMFEGAKMTVSMTKDVAKGLYGFIGDIFTGDADLNQVSGPIGIVGLVGDATQFGFVYLLGFTAFISLNLAVLNLIPFPALDGGRLLFVLIEGIIRKPIKTSVANTLNAVGFGILILLMIVVTVSDVVKLF